MKSPPVSARRTTTPIKTGRISWVSSGSMGRDSTVGWRDSAAVSMTVGSGDGASVAVGSGVAVGGGVGVSVAVGEGDTVGSSDEPPTFWGMG